MFELEILDVGKVYAWNVWDQGFDTEDKIRNQILEDHKDILIQISKDMENKEDMEFNQKIGAGSFGSDWQYIG